MLATAWNNPANIETLKRMWLDGASASEIARALGQGVTRNAVIGKVTRLKLPSRVKPAPKIAKPAKPKGRSNPGVPNVAGILHRAAGRERAALRQNEPFRMGTIPTEDDGGVDVTHLIGIEQLRSGTITQCRYIHGEAGADARYCGKPVKAGSSWCPTHYARVFAGTGRLDD